MKKSRILSLVCALAICIGTLASCTSAPKTPAGSGSTGTTPPAANGEIPTLTWWTVGGTVPAHFSEGIDNINAYLEEKIGAHVDIKVAGWGDYDTKMNTIVNSGEYFDLMFINNTKYGRYVNMGAFADITDLLQSATPDLYKFVPELLWQAVQVGGKIYSVPTYKDSSMAQFWMLDDKYVQKYNIDMASLKEMKDLDAPFRAMKEGEGKTFYPVKISQGSLWNGFFNDYDGICSGLQPMGVKFDDKERKVVNTLEQPEIVENFKLLHSWYKDGIINPDANVSQEDYKGNAFGTAQGWPGAVTTWQTLQGVEKYNAVRVFGPLYTTETIQGSMNAISKNSKYPEHALKLLELVNTDHKLRDMLAYGIEGKDFEYESENVVKVIDDSWQQGLAKYTQGTFFNMSTTSDGDPNQWNDVLAQNEQAFASTCMGFALDTTNIQNEVTNCVTVWDKYKYDLLTGASDPTTVLPEVIKELKAAGLDTVISEAQKQIDEFFA